MKKKARHKTVSLASEALRNWWDSDSFLMGGALAYSMVFSIGPIVLLLVSALGFLFGNDAAKGMLFNHLKQAMGPEVASAVESMLTSAYEPRAGSLATLIGTIVLAFVATGVGAQLKFSLNRLLNLTPVYPSAIRMFIRRRVMAFLLIVVLGIILFVLLAGETLISASGLRISESLSISVVFLRVLSFSLSFVLLTVLISFIFKFLPDAALSWKAVLIGASVTSFLFALGKVIIGLYIGRTSTVSVFGAAGSIIVILITAYYFSQILFLGAHFTVVLARSENPRGFPRKQGP